MTQCSLCKTEVDECFLFGFAGLGVAIALALTQPRRLMWVRSTVHLK